MYPFVARPFRRRRPKCAPASASADDCGLQLLPDVFGYSAFRGEQRAIVEHVAGGGDALVLMPTGGGSRCAIRADSGPAAAGHAMVVSP